MENVQLYQELEQKVTERTARLKAVNEELESFSYSVSHDLRAPLRHIQGYTDMLRDHAKDSLDAKSRRYLTSVSEAAQRMSTLIEDLLDFSRMGRARFQAGQVDMNQLVAEARLELAPEIQSRKITWKIGEVPAAHGDRAMLKQVWLNLLSNAVKYSRKATPAKIIVGAKQRDGDTEYFVQDNGAGFDMKYADKLFGVFQRLHRADQFEGSGIGLANVRRIITRHGGRTWAEAKLERGAKFYFTLPTSPQSHGHHSGAEISSTRSR
jgi:light-regulated signal transduction histidine kinase (bacteriophytochrome)